MRISVVTLHSQENNFGSVLQSYATSHFLAANGYEVEVINYRPFYSNGAHGPRQAVRKLMVNLAFLPFYVKRSVRFNRFISQQKLTRLYRNFEDLRNDPPSADVYIVGSDQVWNSDFPCGNDPTYYLEFVSGENKMSYASSLGRFVADEGDLDALLRRISPLRFVSVRERLSSQQLSERGFHRVSSVLDPVFLLTNDHYCQICEKIRTTHSAYILVYAVEQSSLLSETVDEVSRMLGKKVIQVGGFASKCRSAHFPRSAGPLEFLSLLNGADFVITSSFHGTALSHIMEKQFAVVMPRSNTLRVENILDIAGTTDRVVRNKDDLQHTVPSRIDFGEVRKRLEVEITRSKDYLLTSLNQFKRAEGTSDMN